MIATESSGVARTQNGSAGRLLSVLSVDFTARGHRLLGRCDAPVQPRDRAVRARDAAAPAGAQAGRGGARRRVVVRQEGDGRRSSLPRERERARARALARDVGLLARDARELRRARDHGERSSPDVQRHRGRLREGRPPLSGPRIRPSPPADPSSLASLKISGGMCDGVRFVRTCDEHRVLIPFTKSTLLECFSYLTDRSLCGCDAFSTPPPPGFPASCDLRSSTGSSSRTP